ncbi:MAG: DUF4236 domain-containing protein, partial [Anaerolineae bacterium]|nr:DUF4236 domain-containing protein [Anaerolineae bacterium]
MKGFRVRKRLRILPGVHLNLSKSGASLSVGPRGAQINIGKRGVRGTLDLPGSGIYYTHHFGQVPGGKPRSSATQAEAPALEMGLLERLTASGREKTLLEGLQAYVTGDRAAALTRLQGALELADAAFLAGVLALQAGQVPEAIRALEQAQSQAHDLGREFAKFGVIPAVDLDLTDEISATLGATPQGGAPGAGGGPPAAGNAAQAIALL